MTKRLLRWFAVGALAGTALVACSHGQRRSTAPTTSQHPLGASTTSTTVQFAPGTPPRTVATTARATSTSATPSSSTTAADVTTTTIVRTTAPTAVGGRTTVPAVPGGTTTTDPDATPAFACQGTVLLDAYRASQRLPAGARIDRVSCYGVYAAGVLSAPGADSAFAVFGAGTSGWQLLNVGTAFVCQPLEIPDPAYTTIGCPMWDR